MLVISEPTTVPIRQSEDGKDIVMLDTEGAGHLVGIVRVICWPDRSHLHGRRRASTWTIARPQLFKVRV